jgi:hypothetical protein
VQGAPRALCQRPPAVDTLQQRRSDQNEARTRLRQPPVDLPQERLAKHDVLLAEPDRHALGYEQVVQLRSNTAPVIPRVAEEDVAKAGTGTRVKGQAARSPSSSSSPAPLGAGRQEAFHACCHVFPVPVEPPPAAALVRPGGTLRRCGGHASAPRERPRQALSSLRPGRPSQQQDRPGRRPGDFVPAGASPWEGTLAEAA